MVNLQFARAQSRLPQASLNSERFGPYVSF